MYLSYDKNNIVRTISNKPIKIADCQTIETQINYDNDIIGKMIINGPKKDISEIKVALICNWGDKCGIASYTQMLIEKLRPKVGEIKIFAEEIQDSNEEQDLNDNVKRCWKRGETMIPVFNEIKQWNADFVFIQHEFGIFPKATHFLKLLELLDQIPYVITLHSVYEHLDKTICSAYIKNMIVHTEEGKNSLHKLGHLNNVHVIYHGCVEYKDHSELWNIFQNEYSIIQFGFGFNYKGVDCAIDAIAHLKETQPNKFNEIFFCYMCTESPHTRKIQNNYYNYLNNKVKELNLENNIVIVRGFLSESHICNFLRTAKLAIFPYKNDEKNVVYGASGAIRKAMANGIPIIASDCHLFDDMNGVIPRVSNHVELAAEIDKVFSDQSYRKELISKNLDFVQNHSWENVAQQHLAVFKQIIDNFEKDFIRI